MTGPDIPIMVDTNCAWLPDAAYDAVMAMKQYDPLWVEEPIWPAEDVDALGKLRKTAGVPLAAGENATGTLEFVRLAAAGIDYLQPSAVKNGLTAQWTSAARSRQAAPPVCRIRRISARAISRRCTFSRRKRRCGARALLLRSRAYALRGKRADPEWRGADSRHAGAWPRSRRGADAL